MKNINFILSILMLFCFNPFIAQQEKNNKTIEKITGKVEDENGELLPGATIMIKNTTKGVSTGFDGTYSIDTKVGDTLVASFIGMKNGEIIVNETKNINFKLKAEPKIESVVLPMPKPKKIF